MSQEILWSIASVLLIMIFFAGRAFIKWVTKTTEPLVEPLKIHKSFGLPIRKEKIFHQVDPVEKGRCLELLTTTIRLKFKEYRIFGRGPRKTKIFRRRAFASAFEAAKKAFDLAVVEDAFRGMRGW